MSQSFKLYRLQQFDSKLDQSRIRLQETEKALADDAALKQAKMTHETGHQTLLEKQKILRRAEDESLAQRIKIEQTEAALYGGKVKNPKELQDLQNELASLKKYSMVLEDQQLDAMLAVEEAEEKAKDYQDALDQVISASEARAVELTRTRDQLNKEILQADTERASLASTINNDDLKLYEQIRVQRRGVAVSLVADQSCAACGSTLTQGLIQAALSPNQIMRCTFCGRILYAG